MSETKNSDDKNEIFNKEIYRLFVFYKLLVRLLESVFSGFFAYITDEINRNYLRLCAKIREILEKQGFEDLNKYDWRPFDNLKYSSPDDDIEWKYDIKQRICGKFLSIVEELYIGVGEKEYPLSDDDLQLLDSIQIYLTAKKNTDELFSRDLPKIVKEYKLQEAKKLSDKLENLTDEEKETLKSSIDDVVKDTPKAEKSASKIKNLLAKAGKKVGSALERILVEVASETAKRVIKNGS